MLEGLFTIRLDLFSASSIFSCYICKYNYSTRLSGVYGFFKQQHLYAISSLIFRSYFQSIDFQYDNNIIYSRWRRIFLKFLTTLRMYTSEEPKFSRIKLFFLSGFCGLEIVGEEKIIWWCTSFLSTALWKYPTLMIFPFSPSFT